MGSHSVTCHPTQVNAPRLTPAMQASTRFRCGGPKGMEPAAGAFTDIRDSRALQDVIKDLSSLYPVTVTNC